MAVAYDTATESVRTGVEDPYEFSHTPTGTPRGVVLAAVQNASATDHIAGVTYGGVTMSRVATGADTSGEPGMAYLYFLGSNIPTGTQTVSIDNDATGEDFHFVCVTLTADADTEVVDFDTIDTSAALDDPSLTLQYGGRTCISIGALYSGLGVVANATPNGDMTAIHDHDFSANISRVDRQTTPGSADFTYSYATSTGDDVGMVVAAIGEVVSAVPRYGYVNFQDPGVL